MNVEGFNSRLEQSLMPVVARWANQDKDLLLPLFSLIASGETLLDARFAENLGRGTDAVNAALSASLAEIDAQGHIAELFGITREPTLHRIDVGEDTLYSCCALVAHMIAAIWRRPANIESTDPVNGSTIRLAISADSELQQVEPANAYASMVDCTVKEIMENARSKFCCHVKHFTTVESAAEFSSQSAARYVMRVEDFHEGAQWLYSRIWR